MLNGRSIIVNNGKSNRKLVCNRIETSIIGIESNREIGLINHPWEAMASVRSDLEDEIIL